MNVTINLKSLIAQLSEVEKKHFYQAMSIEDAVIGHVVDQMMVGCTENGYEGTRRIGVATWDRSYPYPIERARQYMIIHAEEATKLAFKELVERCTRTEEEATKRNDEHLEMIRSLEAQIANICRTKDDQMRVIANKDDLIRDLRLHIA